MITKKRLSIKRLGRNRKYLGRNKGYFFSIDAVTAVGILLIGIFLVFYIISSEPMETPAYHLSEDIINVLSKTEISNLSEVDYFKYKNDYPEVYNLIKNKETDNTVLEQVGEYYYDYSKTPPRFNSKIKAKDLVHVMVKGLIPNQYRFTLRIVKPGGTFEEIYTKQSDITLIADDAEVRIAIKKMVFGQTKENDVWGPYVVEAVVWR